MRFIILQWNEEYQIMELHASFQLLFLSTTFF